MPTCSRLIIFVCLFFLPIISADVKIFRGCIRHCTISVISSLLGSGNLVVESKAAHAVNLQGQEIFKNSCSGCHDHGGNLFNGMKTLSKKDLVNNNYAEPLNLQQLIKVGRGQMPAYGEFTSPVGNIIPAKLTDSQINDVADYILEMSEQGWPETAKRNCDVYPGC